MDFRYIEVKNSELLEKVYTFRYKVFSESEIAKEYFERVLLNNKIESDMYDPYSVHFAVLNDKDEVCATVRLIHHSPCGYPTENGMTFDNSMFDREKLGEMSRIFVDSRYRSIKNTKKIITNLNKMTYIKMKELGIEYTYGALEPRFIRLLKMYKMFYETIGDLQPLGTMGLRNPCILYTKRLGDENPELVKAWDKANVNINNTLISKACLIKSVPA